MGKIVSSLASVSSEFVHAWDDKFEEQAARDDSQTLS
jgi:hypothetical protein